MPRRGRPPGRIVVRSGISALTYAQKVARGICVRCHATRLPEEIHARCDDCLAEIRRQHKVAYRKKGGRAAKRRYYRAHRTEILADQAARRERKKLKGECYDCPAECREDALRCDSCSAKASERAAEAWAERKAA